MSAAVVCIVFGISAAQLLLGANAVLPLDRRLSAVLGAAICKAASNPARITEFVDFKVLLILVSIMALNFLMTKQPLVGRGLAYVQKQIRTRTPDTHHHKQGGSSGGIRCTSRSLWIVSLCAFLAAAVFTNDGVVLILTDPVLDAFLCDARDSCDDADTAGADNRADPANADEHSGESRYGFLDIPDPPPDRTADREGHLEGGLHGLNGLNGISGTHAGSPGDAGADASPGTAKDATGESVGRRTDRLYFMLALACAANIGSATTLVGNPQQMLIGTRGARDINSGRFFAVMLLPSCGALVLTVWWIDQCRQSEHDAVGARRLGLGRLGAAVLTASERPGTCNPLHDGPTAPAPTPTPTPATHTPTAYSPPLRPVPPLPLLTPNTSPRPTPHLLQATLVFPAISAVIILELIGAVPLDLLFSLAAIFLVPAVLLGNIYRLRCLDRNSSQVATRHEQITHAAACTTDEVFASLDYNLLIIFAGAFVVSGCFLETGVPDTIWAAVAGQPGGGPGAADTAKPTDAATPANLACLSCLIVLGSQLLGNVPIVYMASGMIAAIPDGRARRVTWLVVSWTSTIGGNLLLSGSACNIIVAEKSARHRLGVAVTAWQHARVCAGVTLASVGLGAVLVVAVDALLP